jgi:hypothetical protein
MIQRIEASGHVFDIHRDLSVSARTRKPGPPERIDGATLGVVSMSGDAPTAAKFIQTATRS